MSTQSYSGWSKNWIDKDILMKTKKRLLFTYSFFASSIAAIFIRIWIPRNKSSVNTTHIGQQIS